MSSPAPTNQASDSNVICSFSIPSSRISGSIANDNLLHLVKDAERQYNVAYEYSSFSSSSSYTTVTFAGTFASVCKARSFVLGHLVDKVCLELNFSYSGLTYEKDLESRFVELAKSVSPNIQISVEAGKAVSPPPGLSAGESSPKINSSNQTSQSGIVVIKGPAVPCQQAYIKSLVLIDRLRGYFSDLIEVDSRLHYLIAGPKFKKLFKIAQKSGCQLYLPSPLVAASIRTIKKENVKLPIYITSISSENLETAKNIIAEKVSNLKNIVISRSIKIPSRKLDLIQLLNDNELISDIMYKHGVALEIPFIGSMDGNVQIVGSNEYNINNAVEELTNLSASFHSTTILLKNSGSSSSFNLPNEENSFQFTDFTGAAQSFHQLSHAHGGEIFYRKGLVEITGTPLIVKTVFSNVCKHDIVKTNLADARYSLEQPLESKDFVSGKKDGKINKVVRSSGAKVGFRDCNGVNLYIDISASSHQQILQGLELIYDELPSELSFYIPEMHHKRIIGHGGKNIQKIMKKFGVYVKFLNSEETIQKYGREEGTPVSLMHNVIVRTPSKNSENLRHLRESILELVEEKDLDPVSATISFPRWLQVWMLNKCRDQFMDMLQASQVEVVFPPMESARDEITISGMAGKVSTARMMIKDILPRERYFTCMNPGGNVFALLLAQEGPFCEWKRSLENEFSVTILSPLKDELDRIKGIDKDGSHVQLAVRSTSDSKVSKAAETKMQEILENHSIQVTVSKSTEGVPLRSNITNMLKIKTADTRIRRDMAYGSSAGNPHVGATSSSAQNLQNVFNSKLLTPTTSTPTSDHLISPLPIQTRFGLDSPFSPSDMQTPIKTSFVNSPKFKSLFEPENLASPTTFDDRDFEHFSPSMITGLIGSTRSPVASPTNHQGQFFLGGASGSRGNQIDRWHSGSRATAPGLKSFTPSQHGSSPSTAHTTQSNNSPSTMPSVSATAGEGVAKLVTENDDIVVDRRPASGRDKSAYGSPRLSGLGDILLLHSQGSSHSNSSINTTNRSSTPTMTIKNNSAPKGLSLNGSSASNKFDLGIPALSPLRISTRLDSPPLSATGQENNPTIPSLMSPFNIPSPSMGSTSSSQPMTATSPTTNITNMFMNEPMLFENTPENLKKFLTALDLAKYISVFQEQEVDFHTLFKLNEEDFKELGITKLGARRKLIHALSELSQLKTRLNQISSEIDKLSQ